VYVNPGEDVLFHLASSIAMAKIAKSNRRIEIAFIVGTTIIIAVRSFLFDTDSLCDQYPDVFPYAALIFAGTALSMAPVCTHYNKGSGQYNLLRWSRKNQAPELIFSYTRNLHATSSLG
jgi:hypothetical protein